MGQLTTGIKDFIGVTVAEPLILDKALSAGVFTHRGENCHHLILVQPDGAETLIVEYSLDGTSWFGVAAVAQVSGSCTYDTGYQVGGSAACPPRLVRLKSSGDTDFVKVQVRTYGTTVR